MLTKKIMLSAILLLLAIFATGQGKHDKHEQVERLKAQKVAFITERVGLTSSVAQRFWPVYNEYWAKRDSLVARRSEARKNLKENMEKLTPAQKEASLDLQMSLRLQEAKLDRHYHQKFMEILTIDQVILLYEAQHEFRIRLIKQLRENRDKVLLPVKEHWMLSLKDKTF